MALLRTPRICAYGFRVEVTGVSLTVQNISDVELLLIKLSVTEDSSGVVHVAPEARKVVKL